MYCTGGIRCEKASAVMLNAGFTDVKQLKAGFSDTSKSVAAHIGTGIASSLISAWQSITNFRRLILRCASSAGSHYPSRSRNWTVMSLVSIVPIVSPNTPDSMTNTYTPNRLIEVLMAHHRLMKNAAIALLAILAFAPLSSSSIETGSIKNHHVGVNIYGQGRGQNTRCHLAGNRQRIV